MSSSRRGMTIVELMLGLAIAGFILLSARALLDQIEQSDATLGRIARMDDARANATRVLYALIRDADVRPDSAHWFTADATSAVFSSQCEVPGGWTQVCEVTILLDTGHDSSAVMGELSTGEMLTLGHWAGSGEFRYLETGSTGDRWVSQWGRSIVAPAAMALVIGGDTIVLPVVGR